MNKYKILIINFLFLSIILTFFSCKKQSYTCQCRGGISGSGIEISISTYSIKKAEKMCYSHNSTPDMADGYEGCALK
ncbi:MAG: hypothetical protein IT215_08905 [Chitinophagaceae bacterium]|nr:hypothetical protein [Chitinophagaceae bacterium]HMN31781.1 hypothetical protein [Chitinophagaceae bacterium]